MTPAGGGWYLFAELRMQRKLSNTFPSTLEPAWRARCLSCFRTHAVRSFSENRKAAPKLDHAGSR